MKKMEEKIFQAIGEASMCWEETPKGVYDDVKAKEVGIRLYSDIMKSILDDVVCGNMVMLKIGNIKGMITGICIRFRRRQFEFSYFHNGDVKTIWLSEDEFTGEDEIERTVGYTKTTKP